MRPAAYRPRISLRVPPARPTRDVHPCSRLLNLKSQPSSNLPATSRSHPTCPSNFGLQLLAAPPSAAVLLAARVLASRRWPLHWRSPGCPAAGPCCLPPRVCSLFCVPCFAFPGCGPWLRSLLALVAAAGCPLPWTPRPPHLPSLSAGLPLSSLFLVDLGVALFASGLVAALLAALLALSLALSSHLGGGFCRRFVSGIWMKT